jgi:hypothetical protein
VQCLDRLLLAARREGHRPPRLETANVKITPGGSAKVLDFGLARAMLSDSPAPNISNSPTFHVLATWRAGLPRHCADHPRATWIWELGWGRTAT